ncbi:MAG: T9SS type A sorting domain-containing protein [Bacteroidota bacterium]
MRRMIPLVVLLAAVRISPCFGQAAVSPVVYTVPGSTYSQNFDGLPNSGTFSLSGKGPFNLGGSPVNGTNLSGWQLLMSTGSNTNAAFATGTGSSTGNGVYSLGSSGSTERALGSLASSSGIYATGLVLTNQTGNILNSFTISFTAEQWRKGGSTTKNTWAFHYKTGLIAHIDQPGLLDEPNLNFSSVVTTASAASLNGNLPENRQTVSYTVNGIAWKAGEQLLFRWDDADESGSDDVMALDNLSFSASLVSGPPIIINAGVTNIATNSAELNGSINANFAPTSLLVEYDTVNTFTSAVTIHPSPDTLLAGSVPTNISAGLSGLSSGVTYYFRIKAVNQNGTVTSTIQNFTTLIALPTVTTVAASSIVTNTAVLGGNVSAAGGAAVTERGIVWSLSGIPTISNNKFSMGNGIGNFSQQVSGLPQGNIVYVRAYAINVGGIAYGDTIRFTTPTIITTLNTISTAITNAITVAYILKTEQNVSGLTAANFSLATNGIAAAAITSIAGAANTFTITVNTGTGSGTLGLNFINDAGLSLPVFNKPFSSSTFYTIDRTSPEINKISIADRAMKVGDTIPVTFLVKPDPDIYKMSVGNIDGFNLSEFSKKNDSTYTAIFFITNGGDDIAATNDIPFTISLMDVAGNTTLLQSSIKQSSDGIDANKPFVLFIQNPANGIYRAGDTLYFTCRFNEKIMVTDGVPSLTLTFGTSTRTAVNISGNGSDSLLFRYIITPGSFDNDGIRTAGVITHNNAVIKDSAGNNAIVSFNNTLATKEILIDAVIPVISSVTVPVASIYKTGNILDFIVSYSKKIFVTNSSAVPSLIIGIGSKLKNATLVNGSGSNTLLFRYTIQQDDVDVDGPQLISLSDSSFLIRDSVGNRASVILNNAGSMAGIQVNPPTISLEKMIVPANDVYKTGDTLDFYITYNENVFVTTTNGTPSLKLTIGSTTKQAAYTIGSGTNTLQFSYIIEAGDEDIDGIKIANSLTLNNGSIKDAQAGNAPLLVNNPAASNGILVDAVAPVIGTVQVPANRTYKSGDTLNFVLNFSEQVFLTQKADTPVIKITIGAEEKNIVYSKGSGSTGLTFIYIIQSGDLDKDGITIGSTILLYTSALTDKVGNTASTSFKTNSLANIKIDAVVPVISSSVFPTAGVYTTGNTLDLMISYSKKVFVSGNEHLPFLSLIIGDRVKAAAYINGSGTNSLLFRYTIQPDDLDTNGIQVISALNDDYFIIKDSAGNGASVILNNSGTIAGTQVNPPIAFIDEIIVPENSTYKTGDTLAFIIKYSENVFVTTSNGTPSLKLTIGSVSRQAVYTNYSANNILRFAYIIQAGDEDIDGIKFSATVTLNNGTIKTSLGNNAILSLPSITTNGILVDAISPVITSVQVPANKTYKTGDTLGFVLNFSEPVFLNIKTDTPLIKLSIGTEEKNIVYSKGSGSTSLTFNYIIQPGDVDKNGLSISSAILLYNSTLTDKIGNTASVNLKTSSLSNIKVDAVLPLITGVSSPAAGIYTTGNDLEFTISYSKRVFVTASDRPPFLSIGIGDKTRNAVYINGSGSNSIVFRYKVQADDIDVDGIALTASLNDYYFSVKDSIGNNASALLNKSGIIVGTQVNPPIVFIKELIIPGNGIYKTGDTLTFSARYNEDVIVTTTNGIPSLKITIGSTSKQVVYINSSSKDVLQFSYIIQSGDEDTDGIKMNPSLSLNNATIKTILGNNAIVALPAANTGSILVDAVSPVINNVQLPANRTYKSGDTLGFVLNFSEPVVLTIKTDTPVIKLTIGTEEKNIVYSKGSGSSALTFNYIIQPTDVDKNGLSIGSSIQLYNSILSDQAGNIASSNFKNSSLSNIKIDAVSPVVNNVGFPATGIYTTGNTFDFTVSYSKKVFVTANEHLPFLSVEIGDRIKNAVYLGGSGSSTILFRYTVLADDVDTDGIQLQSPVNDPYYSLKDSVGNVAGTALNKTGVVTGTQVNPPILFIEKVTVPEKEIYKTGDTLKFYTKYNDNVFVTTSAGIPSLKITIGATSNQAVYVDGSGTATLCFAYTIEKGDEDTDGVKPNSSITLNNSVIRSKFGNNALLTLPAVNTNDILVDAVSPSINNVQAPANRTYKAGDTLGFVLNFSEPVILEIKKDTPVIKITIGTEEKNLAYNKGSGSEELTFFYIIQPGDIDKNGTSIGSSIMLFNTALTDKAGNAASLTFKTASLSNIKIDAVSPAINSISLPAPGVYTTGNNLDFTVAYSKKVFIAINEHLPLLSIVIGDRIRNAVYANGSGSSALLFRYMVQADDIDTNGIQLNSVLNDSYFTIKDSVGNIAPVILNNSGIIAGIQVNPPIPFVNEFAVPGNGTYKTGDTLRFYARYSENVLVTTTGGLPSLKITIGATPRQAVYINNSQKNSLQFAYIIQVGDDDTDGIKLNSSITLNSGTIKSTLGNNAILALPDINTTGIVVDAVAPVISSVDVPTDRTYKAGDTLGFTLNFSEPVNLHTIKDTPTIKITIGNTVKNMWYVKGSGSSEFLFTYIVQYGDLDKNGVSIGSSILLNNNMFTDNAGNIASVGLKNIGPLSNVKIDAVSPVFTIIKTDTIQLCTNSAAVSISNAFAVTDEEAGELVSWKIKNKPKYGEISLLVYSANSTGKNIIPAGIQYTPYTGQFGMDSVVTEITDGVNTSQKMIVLNILPPLQNNTIGSAQIVCVGQTVSSLSGTEPVGGNGQYKYIWETTTAIDSSHFNTATNANSEANYSPSPLNSNSWFRRRITSGACSDTSNTIKITVLKTGLWTGNYNNDWQNTKNWCGNSLPNSTSDLLIPANTLYEPLITDTARCNQLVITANTHLSIKGILELNGNINADNNAINAVNGSITFTGSILQTINGKLFEKGTVQNLIINNASGVLLADDLIITGSLLLNNGTLNSNDHLTLKTNARIAASANGTAVKGNVWLEHLLKGGKRRFHLLGNPFANDQGLQMIKDSLDITGDNGSVNGFITTATNQPSAFRYDAFLGNDSTGIDAGWIPFTNTIDNVWKKYACIRLLMRGRPGEGLDGTPAGDGKNGTYLPGSVTLKLKGNINTGDQEILLQKNDYSNYHVLANPFVSNIDLSRVSRGADIGNYFWLWNPLQGKQGGYTSFSFKNKNILPPFGAFIARSNGNNDNKLLLTEQSKSTDALADSVLPFLSDDLSYIELRLETDTIFWDRIVLIQMDSAKTGFDKNDAEKFLNNDVNFYSLSREQRMLSIDARPLNNNSTIPLGIQANEPGTFSIRIAKQKLDPANGLLLHDKYANKWMNLTQDSAYRFTITNDTASAGNNRFEIISPKKPADTAIIKPRIIVKVNPVPARDQVMVQYSAPEKANTSIRILNLSGKPMKTFQLGMQKDGQLIIPVGELVSGIYLLEVRSGDKISTRKIIKD